MDMGEGEFSVYIQFCAFFLFLKTGFTITSTVVRISTENIEPKDSPYSKLHIDSHVLFEVSVF